jgi:hypothetical protein
LKKFGGAYSHWLCRFRRRKYISLEMPVLISPPNNYLKELSNLSDYRPACSHYFNRQVKSNSEEQDTQQED